MMGPATERRARRRFPLKLSVRILRVRRDAWIEGRTADISCVGMYCLTSEMLSPGEEIEIIAELSEVFGPEVAGTELRCWARVLRVESAEREAPYGFACQIEDYVVQRAPIRTAGIATCSQPVEVLTV